MLSCIDQLAPHSAGPRELRQSATLALGFLLDSDADELDATGRAALISTPENFPDQSTRNFALIALARAGGRVGSGMSPGSARPEIAQQLLVQLARGSNMQRPWAALALGLLARRLAEQGGYAPEEWLAPLRQRVRDERSAGDLSAWAIASGRARDESAGEALAERFLDRSDPYARGHLAEAIGLCGHRRAKSTLRAELRDNLYRPVLLSQLSLGLGLLEDSDAVPTLVSLLDEATSLASQASLASALGRIGDRRAVAPLVELLLAGLLRPFRPLLFGLCDPGAALDAHHEPGIHL